MSVKKVDGINFNYTKMVMSMDANETAAAAIAGTAGRYKSFISDDANIEGDVVNFEAYPTVDNGNFYPKAVIEECDEEDEGAIYRPSTGYYYKVIAEVVY